MKQSNLILFVLLILLSFNSGAQCDTLYRDAVAPEGFQLNTQSFLSEVKTTDDLELNIILSGEKLYEFQVIGQREYEVFIKSGLNLKGEEEAKPEKKIVLTNKDVNAGVFRIQPTTTQRVYIRFFGVLGEEGKECTGVMVYQMN